MEYYCYRCNRRIDCNLPLQVVFNFTTSLWEISLANRYNITSCNHYLEGEGETIGEAMKNLDQQIKALQREE